MSNKPPAFQFYPSDWLADAKVQTLTTAQEGIYIRLLCYCWREGSLPADGSAIAQLCKRDVTELDIDHVLKNFFSLVADRYHNKRLDQERQKQISFAKERSKSGKLGAKKRWENEHSSAIAKPMAEPMAKNGFSSTSTSTSADIKREREQLGAAHPPALKTSLPAKQKPKTSVYVPKESIAVEQYQAMLADSTLAAGDRDYLKSQALQMADWSAGGQKKKADWAATLRNWIRRSRQSGIVPNGVKNPKQQKTFMELDDEWQQRQFKEFLDDSKQKKGEIEHA